MNDGVNFNGADVSTPVSLTVDTDLEGVIILLQLIQLSVDLNMTEDYDMNDMYSQIMLQILQFGSLVNLDGSDDN